MRCGRLASMLLFILLSLLPAETLLQSGARLPEPELREPSLRPLFQLPLLRDSASLSLPYLGRPVRLLGDLRLLVERNHELRYALLGERRGLLVRLPPRSTLFPYTPPLRT